MVLITELVFTLIVTFFIWVPTGPEDSSFILNCLGNDDILYFEFDYFVQVRVVQKSREGHKCRTKLFNVTAIEDNFDDYQVQQVLALCWFHLHVFSFVRIFKTVPKYLDHPVYTLFDILNPSFVCKLVTMCIIDFICVFLVCAKFF